MASVKYYWKVFTWYYFDKKKSLKNKEFSFHVYFRNISRYILIIIVILKGIIERKKIGDAEIRACVKEHSVILFPYIDDIVVLTEYSEFLISYRNEWVCIVTI